MSMRSLSSAEWPILARFALMGIEILLVKASLIRGHYEWRDTLASIAACALATIRPTCCSPASRPMRCSPPAFGRISSLGLMALTGHG